MALSAEALVPPTPGTLLQATELLLEKEPLPNEMPLLRWARTEDALRHEGINPSTATNLRNGTRLPTTQAPLIRQPTDDNEKRIHEPMPPRKPRKQLSRRTELTPLIHRPMHATQIQRLNPTNPTPPPCNQIYFFNLFHHLFPETN
jgi:hypothetical protein